MLGDTAEMVLSRWKGDLRRLRGDADRDPDAMRERLLEFKGLGNVGVDIFFREVQVAWDELRPFLDERAVEAARALGLPDGHERLAGLVDRADVARLASALIRAQTEGTATRDRG